MRIHTTITGFFLVAIVIPAGCEKDQPFVRLLPLANLPGMTVPPMNADALAAMPDRDGDGIPDVFDAWPDDSDHDGDGIVDGLDSDFDNDGIPNSLDPDQLAVDTDGDGIPDLLDTAPLDPDVNGNGTADGMETDSDGDGLVDAEDESPNDADADRDGVLDGMKALPNLQPAVGEEADYYVLTNRQKFFGLRSHFDGVEYDDIQYAVAAPPGQGQLLGTAPNLCYVPNAGFEGVDTMTYDASANGQTKRHLIRFHVGPSYVLPIAIPMPEFGILESHWMYAEATFDFGSGPEPYRDAGNGPYTHYVDTNLGDDTNNPFGTAASPRQTIPDTLPAGSVVELHGSGFTNRVRHLIRGIGTQEKPIFLRGANSFNRPVFRRPMEIYADYLIVENLEFDGQDFGPPSGGVGWVRISEDPGPPLQLPDHVCVRHTLVRDQPWTGISGSIAVSARALGIPGVSPDNGTDLIEHVVVYDVEVRNFSQWNDFSGNDDYGGVGFYANTRWCWALDCHVHHLQGDGIGTARPNALPNQVAPQNAFFGRNYVHHCKESPVETKLVSGMVVSQNELHTTRNSDSQRGEVVNIVGQDPTPSVPRSDNVWVLFNRIYDGEYGIRSVIGSPLPAGTLGRCYYIGNLIRDVRVIRGNPDFAGWAIEKTRFSQDWIVGNTITRCEQGLNLGSSQNYVPADTTQVVRNNIVANLKETAFQQTGEHAMHVRVRSAEIIPYTTLDHNLYWEDVGQVRLSIAEPGGNSTSYGTIADFQAQTGFGAGSIIADPLFVNPDARDYRLKALSPAIGAGTPDSRYDLYETVFGPPIRFYQDGTPFVVGRYDMGALPPE